MHECEKETQEKKHAEEMNEKEKVLEEEFSTKYNELREGGRDNLIRSLKALFMSKDEHFLRVTFSSWFKFMNNKKVKKLSFFNEWLPLSDVPFAIFH